MKRIAGAAVGVVAVVGVLLYVVWPIVSVAGKGGDDAPIKLRTGRCASIAGTTSRCLAITTRAKPRLPRARLVGTAENRKWKWTTKGSCRDSHGVQSPCFSREPKNDNHASEDTDREPTLYVKVVPGKYGRCPAMSLTASAELVEFWLNDAKLLYFVLRRNTSGILHYRAQLLPQRPFMTHDQGETLTYGTSKDTYIKAVRVGKDFACTFSAYNPDMEVLICSPWQKGGGCELVPALRGGRGSAGR